MVVILTKSIDCAKYDKQLNTRKLSSCWSLSTVTVRERTCDARFMKLLSRIFLVETYERNH